MAQADRDDAVEAPWYAGIGRYQWTVLTVASLGWVFDIFEGQVFVASMREAMPSLVATDADQGHIDFLNKLAMASFLLGGALGGVLFGALSDRIGRARTLSLTIVVYSLFTFITAFAQEPWQMIVLRFVVALGTGGEWAVGAAFVAEVFPKRSRPWMGSIFHASSVFGTFLAILAGAYVIGNPRLGEHAWRWGFALGVLPALLVLWIRRKVNEPAQWVAVHESERTGKGEQAGRVGELFSKEFRARTLIGVGLATSGLATFWGTHIFGKSVTLHYEARIVFAEKVVEANSVEDAPMQQSADDLARLKNAEMLGMFLTALGAGLGLLSFGAFAKWLGRRGAFFLFYVGGFLVTIATFQFIYDSENWPAIIITLPIFGFFTVGMHAGYAIYFPELFPTRLRSSGSGFCFNVGRVTAAPILVLTALLQKSVDNGGWGWSNEHVASWMSVLFLAGAVLAIIAPETKSQELPE